MPEVGVTGGYIPIQGVRYYTSGTVTTSWDTYYVDRPVIRQEEVTRQRNESYFISELGHLARTLGHDHISIYAKLEIARRKGVVSESTYEGIYRSLGHNSPWTIVFRGENCRQEQITFRWTEF